MRRLTSFILVNDVSSLGRVLDGRVLELGEVLPRKTEDRGSGFRLERDEVGSRGLVSVRGSPDGAVGESPEPGDGLDRLVGGSILSESDGAGKAKGQERRRRGEKGGDSLVGSDPDDLVVRKGRETDGSGGVGNLRKERMGR